MINNVNEGNGGVNIKPSARRSIHDHSGSCPIRLNETMGRYGCHLQKRGRQGQASQAQRDVSGSDEVDNVMSKMTRSSTPLSIPRDVCRRNSVDAINYDQSDDDSDEKNLLSKSSPATFSQLHYSDEYSSAVQHENNISRNGLHTSHNSHLAQTHYSDSDTHHELNTRPEMYGGNKSISTSLAIIAIVVAVTLCIKSDISKVNLSSIKSIFQDDINNIGLKYKLNRDAIIRIQSGLSTIFNKEDTTGSFIFVYNSNADTFKPAVFNNFIKELASKTVKFLRSGGDSALVVLDTRSMQTDEDLISLRDEVARTGVMVVPDVHEVPSELAMAFHFYCDEYDPLVKRSAIFFTLDWAICLNGEVTHEYIEKCLLKKWKNIGEDKIGPLLTRVVSIIVDTTNI